VTLRRYTPLKASAGTRIPDDVDRAVRRRDMNRCVGPLVGMAPPCQGAVERDHVRASHGMGMKSESTLANCLLLCGRHHRVKTENGTRWRQPLLDYIERMSRAAGA
jgi:hypothetical protein